MICLQDPRISKLFLGVFASDNLPVDIPLPSCLIGNTKPSTHKGEHWIAIHIDEHGHATYFCSFGRHPNKTYGDWLRANTTQYQSTTKKIQSDKNTTCGQYCACFLYFCCRAVYPTNFLSLFSDSNRDENDLIVTIFVNTLFNMSTIVRDARFLK